MADEERNDPHNQLIPQHEIEHCDKLFKAEASFMADPGYWRNVRAATLRRYAVSCIEDYSKCESFDAFVPYLAMTYFDRLISRHKIMPVLNDEQMNKDLFVICCLTIAWKMRTKSFKVAEFLPIRKKNYEASDVMKMELYILNQLEWRMRSLTPISFAEYFISFLMPQEDQISLTRRFVRQIIVTSQADIRITRFRPSLVAASVVSAVSSKRFPTQSSRFEASLSRCQYAGRELSSCKKVLKNLCKAKLEIMMSPSAEEKTSNETSSSGVVTSEVAGASSASLQASLPPGVEIGKKSAPVQIGGDPPGTIELQSVKHTISSSLLQASMPPGATADDKGKAPIEEIQLEPKGKEPIEEIQVPDPKGKAPIDEIQPEPKGKAPIDEIQPEPKPAPANREDLQLDFELEWSKYPELLALPRGSFLDRLAYCCPTTTTGDTDNRCLIL